MKIGFNLIPPGNIIFLFPSTLACSSMISRCLMLHKTTPWLQIVDLELYISMVQPISSKTVTWCGLLACPFRSTEIQELNLP